ncbi:hypothetical protein GCM10011395_30170 [Sphingomonas psychrolutea]|uniref:DUF1570 domain-containing protein n=1 Tax=Sphingomonas psychrolutea TaxID=1259676 RepID=A0ABQ1H590_9SPHN|nr:hypothetical protein GCM10011395_30170 [Sphingomonas psychrolutea]
MFRKALLLCACLIPSAALAEWQEASSRHFVLYSNDKPERVRAFTTKLERFDKALRVQRGMPDAPISPETRLTVYVVDTIDDVQKLVPGQENVAGFYAPRAHPVAFVPRQSGTEKTDLNAQQILLHEYTHHFMLSNWTNAAFPAWFVEGFAEFNATAMFRDDGGITLGAAPQYRAFGVFNSDMLPMSRVLSPDPGRMSEEQTDVLYGRGWLLTHYLTFEPSRAGQLDAYIDAINAGKPVTEAKHQLKDVDKLDRVLDRYAEQSRLPARTLTGSALAVGETTVRALTPAEAAVMPARIRSAAGVGATQAQAVVVLARRLAAPYPQDAAAQNVLAEAEYDAGNYTAAEAAADRALATAPKSMHAMLYKGMALAATARTAKKTDAATWSAVRHWFLVANKVDTEDPLPLTLFYNSFGDADQPPTKNADAALLYAYALAPYDLGLRMQAGRVYLQQGNAVEARRAIVPLAYSAHGSGGDRIQQVLAMLDQKGSAAALTVLDKPDAPSDAKAGSASGKSASDGPAGPKKS